MGMSNAGEPTDVEKQKFLKKIQEWKALGFETGDLEELLNTDFNEFLRRRHLILKEQLKREKPPAEETAQGIVETGDKEITELESDSKPGTPPEDEAPEDEELLLIGAPLAPETEAELEAVDESVIEIGKPPKKLRSKAHPSRKKMAEAEEPEEAPVKKSEQVTTSVEEEEELADELEPEAEEPEETFDEEYDEFEAEEEEFEEEPVKKARKVVPRGDGEQPEGSVGGRIAGAAVIIIVILSIFYFGFQNPIIDFGGNGGTEDGEVKADFEIVSPDGFFSGSAIIFDAFNSTGKGLRYKWTIDSDFKYLEGDQRSERIKGYFVISQNSVVTKIISLEVSNNKNEDTISKDVDIKPRTFELTEESLSDEAHYKVSGTLDVSNPDGIYTITSTEGSLVIEKINLIFKTEDDQGMQTLLTGVDNVEDGFGEKHSVYERKLTQDLVLSGTVTVKPIIPGSIIPPISVATDITGSMLSTDKSYTTYQTQNTIYGLATNELNVTVQAPAISGYQFDGFEIVSKDSVESYPDLRKDPRNIRLTDLATDVLEIGDGDSFSAGGILYHWDAEKIEYVYDNPAIMVNLTIDQSTMDDYKLTKFFSAFWIAEHISQPVKTHLHAVRQEKGNTTVLNYVSEMTYYKPGVGKISSQSGGAGSGQFLDRRPGYDYIPSSNWSFIPPTGKSTAASPTSFEPFTVEQAINHAKNHEPFIDFNASHDDVYVVDGHCTATGDGGNPTGVLVWNLTFGNKDPKEALRKDALNLLILKDGSVTSKSLEIDPPPNSTNDFEPLLTFASSEDVFLNYSDKIFYNLIFNSNNKIDFENVKYGIETNLEYPNLEITSIIFTEHSKYSYLVTYTEDLGDTERIVTVVLDAETGQLLFYWDHKGTEFDLF
jgi:hypothetical protein